MTLDELGWSGALPRLEDGGVLGRVAIEHRGGYVVMTAGGELAADVAGRLRHDSTNGETTAWPAVGDWVVCRTSRGVSDGRGAIQAVLARRSMFVRKEAGRSVSGQVVAANVDFVFLVTSLPGDLNSRRLERYVALAVEGNVAPVIVVAKADLAEDSQAVEKARDRAAGTASWVPVHVVSALEGQGLDALEAYFDRHRTVALIGSSGVGKSTLINRLLGREVMRVQELRADGRGKHTTTHRALVARPGGGLLIDTPGMRELALFGSDEGVSATFSDIEELAIHCRFSDCTHRTEPGCAVLDAVRFGRLPPARLASLEKLRGELRHLEAKDDRKAQLARKRRDKEGNRALYRLLDERKRGL